MAEQRKITVDLTLEMADVLREALASGEYASEEEVVREAFHEWLGRRVSSQQTDSELAELWDRGISSGVAVDGEEAFARIRSRLEGYIGRNAQ